MFLINKMILYKIENKIFFFFYKIIYLKLFFYFKYPKKELKKT
jgi:hypothetical protein